MNIKKIAARYTRKEFMKHLTLIDDDGLMSLSFDGKRNDEIYCPHEIGLKNVFKHCGPFIFGCDFCWETALRNVKFKGENKDTECKSKKCLAIKDLVKEAHGNALKHGFWKDFVKAHDENRNADCNAYISQFLMLIASEVSEAEQALRKKDLVNFREELADIVIRVFDLSGGLNIDLQSEILKKMQKNKSREYKHGKAF